jgi:hypothetical protein
VTELDSCSASIVEERRSWEYPARWFNRLRNFDGRPGMVVVESEDFYSCTAGGLNDSGTW